MKKSFTPIAPRVGTSLKRLTLVLALALLYSCAAAAQGAGCTVKLSELPAAPEMRGFSLGMTVEQVKARLPKLRLRSADEFGFASVNFFPEYEEGIDKAAFEGVRTVTLEFLDGRVSSLWIGYDKTFKWQTVDEFAAGVAASLRLNGPWRQKFRTRILDCADFTAAIVPVGDSPSIKLSDDRARETLDQRKAAKEEAQPQSP